MTRRPLEAIFADGRKPQPMALHPSAVNVSYPTIEASLVAEVVDGVAVICVDGPIEHHSTWWANYEDLAVVFKSCCDDASVNGIILKFDSPGGECAGLNETVAIMQGMKAASGKPVSAYVDESCFSAAYALAMVADEIFLPESGGVGSIGVITAMIDVTGMNEKEGIRVEVVSSGAKKADGHPCVAISEGAIKRTQQQVDKLATAFFDIVSAGRGLSVDTIEGFQAGTFMGSDAVSAGLADGVMSFDECLTIAKSAFNLSSEPTNRLADKGNSPMAGKIAAAKAAAEDAKLRAAAPSAKVTKTKTVTIVAHEEEVDDGKEEAEFPEDEPGDDGEGGGEDDGDGEDDGEDAKKSKASVAENAILAMVRTMTGHGDEASMLGALRGMAASAKRNTLLEAKVAKLEADATAAKLNALISSGTKAGKLTPGQRTWALTQSPESLKAFLDHAPKMVQTIDDPNVQPLADLTPREIAKCKAAGVNPEKYAAMKATMNTGKKV